MARQGISKEQVYNAAAELREEGDVCPNPRKFPHPNSNSATIVSKLIIWPSLRNV